MWFIDTKSIISLLFQQTFQYIQPNKKKKKKAAVKFWKNAAACGLSLSAADFLFD